MLPGPELWSAELQQGNAKHNHMPDSWGEICAGRQKSFKTADAEGVVGVDCYVFWVGNGKALVVLFDAVCI